MRVSPSSIATPLLAPLRQRALAIFAIPAAIIGLALCAAQAIAQDNCGEGRDFVVQALEQIKTGTPSEVEAGLQLLKHANSVCVSSGDAWYYRSLFEGKLGRATNATYALGKAKLFGSDAMSSGANPFVLAAPPQPDLKTLPPIHNKWALVIGISQFQDPSLDLKFTGKDAKDFASVLVDPKLGRFPAANVHTITAGVTTRQLKEQLNWLARSAEPDDLVLIFLASHGTSRSQDTADVNYVVTSDTDLKDQDSLFSTSIAMVDISDIVRTRVRARRTVILLDTCHSGGAGIANRERALQVSESAPSASVLERISQGIGRAILSSSQEDQSSYEGAPFQNGYFTHFLIEAIRRNNGMDSIEQMFPYLRDQVSKAAATKSTTRGAYVAGAAPAAKSANLGQTPVLTASDIGGTIVLGAPVSGASGQ
jgi:uncharacterized caspase-like protein